MFWLLVSLESQHYWLCAFETWYLLFLEAVPIIILVEINLTCRNQKKTHEFDGFSLLEQCYHSALNNCCGHLESKWRAAVPYVIHLYLLCIVQGLDLSLNNDFGAVYVSLFWMRRERTVSNWLIFITVVEKLSRLAKRLRYLRFLRLSFAFSLAFCRL